MLKMIILVCICQICFARESIELNRLKCIMNINAAVTDSILMDVFNNTNDDLKKKCRGKENAD